ncbi:hypothetical protein GIB67_042838 [Kingdonia uniflora]|uniref:DUF7866 domain-containing protein n=1 Tax=Kingdonia uniflora TaxID=39325 RepID=A0A7J7NSG2_9MAGN|nr:hypothetical protein GIB67_042838 [Kingdonia uniflora]
MSISGVLFFLIIIIPFINQPSYVNGGEMEKDMVMTPLIEPQGKLMTMLGSSLMFMNETHRRRLASFKICGACTCCGGPKRLCVFSSCCYAINCNIPNRPFGFCSFTPKSCNCFRCHL